MNNFIKVFKYNFKNNLSFFCIVSLIGILSSVIFNVLDLFDNLARFERTLENSFILKDANSYKLLDYIQYYITMSIPVIMIVIAVYLIVTTYKRFSNTSGDTFTMIQLPVKKYFHIFSIIIETLIFTSIQYLSMITCIYLSYMYKYSIYLKNIHIFNSINEVKLLESFSEYVKHIGVSVIHTDIADILYRLTVTNIALALIIISIMLIVSIYKTKGVISIITGFVLIVILRIYFNVNSVLDVISYTLEEISMKNFISSISIIIICTIVTGYLYRNKYEL